MANDDKLILIGVTGSIAAYKTCDLVRGLVKRGLPVQVILTESAERFVGKVTFQALTSRPVYANTWENGMVHIEVKNQAGIFAIVPATANIIGKMANGIADDLVSSTYLAVNCPVFVAPAMNPFMYSSKPVQRNLKTLKEDGVRLIDPAEGEVICGDEGQGKMAEVLQIEETLAREFELVRDSVRV